MKRHKYMVILIIGIIVWFAETAHFGFNAKAESGAESFFDMLSGLLMAWGFIGDITSNVRITKSYHNVTTNRINTKHVEVTGKSPKVAYNIRTTPVALRRAEKKKSDDADSHVS